MTNCPATRGKAFCGLGYAHLGAHYDASRREAWFDKGAGLEPDLVVICNAISHKNNPRGSEVPCTFKLGHNGGHSWGDPTTWPDFPQSGDSPDVYKAELRIHAADRLDPGGIERGADAPPPGMLCGAVFRNGPGYYTCTQPADHPGPHFGNPIPKPTPLPLPQVPPGYDSLKAAEERRDREMDGLHPSLTSCPPEGQSFSTATRDALREVGAAAAGQIRREGHSPLRAFGGRFERLTAKGWEPISVPIPPEGHEARWNEMTQTWEFYQTDPRVARLEALLGPEDPVHPSHYKTHPSGIECIDVIEHLDFNIGTAIKYLWRFKDKNGDEDLKKAIWYIDRELKRRAGFRQRRSAGTGPAPDPSLTRDRDHEPRR